jgi:hypothetical protein
MLKYFTSTSDDISNLKLLIKTQGEITCQNNISIQTIKAEINKFDFGYLFYSVKAKSGSRSPRNFADKHILNGFILCSFVDEEEAMIDLKGTTFPSNPSFLGREEERTVGSFSCI